MKLVKILVTIQGLMIISPLYCMKRSAPEAGFAITASSKKARPNHPSTFETIKNRFEKALEEGNQKQVYSILNNMSGIINNPIVDDINPLHIIAKNGNMQLAQILVEDYKLPCASGYFGPFHIALLHGHSDFCDYLICNFGFTIDRPIDPSKGYTPIHIAARLEYLALFKMLIQNHDANPLFFDKKGKSAVAHLAAIPLSPKKKKMILFLLQTKKMSTTMYVTDEGKTLAELAKTLKNSALVELLNSYVN